MSLSARAACRLENLGYGEIHRYVAGKADWFAAGWPGEERCSGAPYVGDLALSDVPTCGRGDTVGEVRERLAGSGWDHCVVVDGGGIVIGLLDGVSHRGRWVTVEDARLYSLPPTPPPIAVAAAGPRSAELAGHLGDALIAVKPDASVVEAFEGHGGSGSPATGRSSCAGRRVTPRRGAPRTSGGPTAPSGRSAASCGCRATSRRSP